MTYEPVWKSTPETWSHLKDAVRQNRKTPTRAEALLWSHLRAGRLDALKFRRQHAIGPCIVDLYCPSARLVIEVDGLIHKQQTEQDAERERFLDQMGLRVIRFTNDQVIAHTHDVLAETATHASSKQRTTKSAKAP